MRNGNGAASSGPPSTQAPVENILPGLEKFTAGLEKFISGLAEGSSHQCSWFLVLLGGKERVSVPARAVVVSQVPNVDPALQRSVPTDTPQVEKGGILGVKIMEKMRIMGDENHGKGKNPEG